MARQSNEKIMQYELKDFSSGLFNSLTDINVPPGGATIAKNVRYMDIGGIKKRESRSAYNATAISSNPIYHSERIYISGESFFIVAHEDDLKVGNDSVGTFSNLLAAGITTKDRFRGVTYKNFHYLFGPTENLRTDGTATNTSAMGTTAPGANPTGAKSSTGSNLDNDTYKYKFSYVYDSYQESSVYSTALTVATDASNLSIDLYDFETVPANASHVNIYRTEGGGTLYYYHSQHTAAQINAYLTGARYNDNTADSGLDTTKTAPIDNDGPSVCPYGILHKDRIFMAGNSTNPSRLFYSKIAGTTSYPDIFPALNYIDVSADDGDEIVGMAHDPTGTLCIFKRATIRKIYTDGDDSNWSVSEPFSYDGCVAPYTLSQSPYGIIYLARQGEKGRQLRLFDGKQSHILTDHVSQEVDKIETSRIEECVGHYAEDKYFLSYTELDSGVMYNNRLMIYSFIKKNVSIDYKNINSFCSWYGAGDRGELYTGDSNNGICYREDTSQFDTIIHKKSQIDAGTFNQTESGGSEVFPTIILTGADLTNDLGASTWSANATPWTSHNGILDTWYTGGTWISASFQIDATTFDEVLWNADLGTTGLVWAYIRTGATQGACESAEWQGPYKTSPGDTSGVTAGSWVQVKLHLFTSDSSISTYPIVEKSDTYVVRFSANLGSASETAIDMNWKSGVLDLGHPRIMKRLRGIRIEYSSDSAGTLYCYYTRDRGTEESTFIKDGVAFTSIDLSTYNETFVANFPASSSMCKDLELRFNMNDTNNLTIKRIVLLYSLKPPRWT